VRRTAGVARSAPSPPGLEGWDVFLVLFAVAGVPRALGSLRAGGAVAFVLGTAGFGPGPFATALESVDG
jgi:hypothetical protein